MDFIWRGPDHLPMVSMSFDLQSRRALRDFAIHLGIGCVAVLAYRAAGFAWTEAGHVLALIFSLNSFVDFCRATLLGQRICSPSLNLWDKAIAFSGCSHLVAAIVR
jgi:hypothetical protein